MSALPPRQREVVTLRDVQDFSSEEVVELLGDYLEGALEPALLADVDRHLEACPPCREFLDQLRTTVGLLGELPPAETIPDPTVDMLVSTFREFTGPTGQAEEP